MPHTSDVLLLSRRLSIFGPAALAACAAQQLADIPPTFATGSAAQREAALPPNAPTLYYVSAPDCPNCRAWVDNTLPTFESSPERARLRFVVLHSYTIHDGSGQDYTWPANLRWIRDAAKADQRSQYLPNTRYTPLWALVRGNEYIRCAHGLREWNEGMWPTLRQVVAAA